jgi:hypothetical protein
MENRGTSSTPSRVDFLALDQPMLNPAMFDRCLVAWGVHRIHMLDLGLITVKVPGGAVKSHPLQMGGLRTMMPAASFQHAFVEAPPLTSVPFPAAKSERGARVFWEEPSGASVRHSPMDAVYQSYPLETYDDLIDHMYPGPEIFCQGLDRDPADSQFVVPFWMPYYDAALGARNHAILIEMVCEPLAGETQHSATAFYITEGYPPQYPWYP